MILYSPILSPRLQYVARFIGQYFSIPVTVITDLAIAGTATGVVINYSPGALAFPSFWVAPSGLLQQTEIRSLTVECFAHPAGFTAFFKNGSEAGFDVLGAVFYLLSRYEEYGAVQLDSYGRFDPATSVAYKNGFLAQPLVNTWLSQLRQWITEKFPAAQLQSPPFQFVPTYDIDIAWSYRHKGLWRNSGGALRSLLKGRVQEVVQRGQVLTGLQHDPYDCYDWLNELHRQHKLSPVYFFHLGRQRNQYDKAIQTDRPAFRQLLRSHAEKYTVGIHPSWQSGDDPKRMEEEKERLESIVEQPIYHSRQHYIRFTLPQTFRLLLAAGIRADYSMGYGSRNGFRASVAFPFYWYDLEQEAETELLVHPFAFMDANSFFEQGYTPQQAGEELAGYYERVKATGGQLVTIWHNTFLGTDALFTGWRDVYQQFVTHNSAKK